MAPPSSPRVHTPSSSITSTAGLDGAPGLWNVPQGPSLYTSILAPPPTKQARTIHNPGDPPVPAPTRPQSSPRTRPSKISPKGEPSRAHGGKGRAPKAAKAAASPRRTKGGSIDKGKRRQHPDDADMDIDGDVDMKAAATLTSLLMHNRPSIAGSASSPRSSIDGGSEYSYAHFVQSSARNAGPTSTTTMPSNSSNLAAEPLNRTQTPPPPPGGSRPQQTTTPGPAPTDSEAANLMLFLATSPSPARPATRDAKDYSAFRTLNGGSSGPLRTKGRVLFPSTPVGDPVFPGYEGGTTGAGAGGHLLAHRSSRSEGSFASVSSLGLGLGAGLAPTRNNVGDAGRAAPPAGTPTAMLSASASSSGGLLPPATLPLSSAPPSPARSVGKDASNSNPPPVSNPNPSLGNKPSEFNFHEFINASPSTSSPRLAPPSAAAPAQTYAYHHGHSHSYGGSTAAHKSNLGLRADVGRKLFEEEQMRQAHQAQQAQVLQAAAAAAAAVGSPGRQEDTRRALGAGIDLVGS